MKQKKRFFFNFISVFGFISVELGLPTLLALMIDKGITQNDTTYVKNMGLLMLGVVVFGVALNILLGYFTSRITTNMIENIRDDLFETVQEFSHNEYEQIGVSSLITRVTNDAYQIMLFMQNILRIGFTAPMMFIVSLYMVVRTSPSLGW